MARENAALKDREKASKAEAPIGFHFRCSQCTQEVLTVTPMFLFGCPNCGAGGIASGVDYMELVDTVYPGWRIVTTEQSQATPT